jgi:transcriptional regulator with XRE-family HTH domain
LKRPDRRDQLAERLDRLGVAMRVLRARRQLTQAEVAARAGVTPNLVSRLESGTANPTFTTLGRVVAGLGASGEELAAAIEEASERQQRSPSR